jgi:hypothetical protein
MSTFTQIRQDEGVSWDLYLIPADHGEDPGDWLEAAAEDGGDLEAARLHAEALVARLPELQLGGPFGDSFQLTLTEDSGFPLDVGLYGNHASISVAYWDLGDRTAELGRLVEEIVVGLAKTTGWVAYDPQEDRVVGSGEIAALFGSGQTHGIDLVKEIAKPNPAPKKKRRFGLF